MQPFRSLADCTREELFRLRDAIKGSEGIVTDTELYQIVDDLVWAGAESVYTWPPGIISTALADLDVVTFCRHAESHADPKHRPLRTLPETDEWECSCNARTTLDKRSLRHQSPDRWLRSDSDFAKTLHLRDVPSGVLLICRAAKSETDLFHALIDTFPGSPSGQGTMRALFTCLCGQTSYDDEMKQISL